MPATVNLKNISIILSRPRYPENIGAAARVMRNMGCEQLIVVDPQNCDLSRVLKMATHAAIEVVEQMQVYEDLPTALEPLNYIVGTTARLGGQRHRVGSATGLAQKLAPISENNRVGLLFGPEDRGLTNADIRLCHELVNIPTAEFSSLNLIAALQSTRGENLCPASREPARTRGHVCAVERYSGQNQLHSAGQSRVFYEQYTPFWNAPETAGQRSEYHTRYLSPN
jgi:tRNA/rRNA methyltransferase